MWALFVIHVTCMHFYRAGWNVSLPVRVMLGGVKTVHCDFIKITDFSRKCFRHICLVSFNAIINNREFCQKKNETSI